MHVLAAAGLVLVLLALRDAFLTILHPDRDGGLSRWLNRAIWHACIRLARLRPTRRHAVLGMAGPTMVLGDILLWMLLPIAGYALAYWPFLATEFRAADGIVGGLGDALYLSGTTFTTLGYGDVTPVRGFWKAVAISEAVSGFLIMGVSVAYILAVFEGVDRRDALALQVYSETSRTWEGAPFIDRTLREEGVDGLRLRLQGWAALVRDLHGRLYRFHGLAFYVRTHSLDLAPERMVYAAADVALRAKSLAALPGFHGLRGTAEQLAAALEQFGSAIVRREGSREAVAAFEAAQPEDVDAWRVRETCAWATGIAGAGPDEPEPATDVNVLEFTARMRVFLQTLDGLTLWRSLPNPKAPSAWDAPRPPAAKDAGGR